MRTKRKGDHCSCHISDMDIVPDYVSISPDNDRLVCQGVVHESRDGTLAAGQVLAGAVRVSYARDAAIQPMQRAIEAKVDFGRCLSRPVGCNRHERMVFGYRNCLQLAI